MPFAWFVFALIALIATLSVTELVRVFAHRLRAVDRPGGRRVHQRPTARLGGLGIYWGFFGALALATYGDRMLGGGLPSQDIGIIGMMVGSSLLLIVGMMDDVYGLKAVLKLVFQIGAALVLYSFGWRVDHVGIPGIGSWDVGVASLPLTVFWVLLVTNAMNLIDGLDGLAGGIALVATLGACWVLAASGRPLVLVAAALAGALIGFLWFNIHPALIFMGDAGSLFVGFVLSAITLRAGQVAAPEAFPLVPMLFLAVPIFDTLDAVRRRSIAATRLARSPSHFVRQAAVRIFRADGRHLHHRLVRAGFSVRQSVMLLLAVAFAFTTAGCAMVFDAGAGMVLLALFGALAGWANWLVRGRVTSAPTSTVTPVGLSRVDAGDGAEPQKRAA